MRKVLQEKKMKLPRLPEITIVRTSNGYIIKEIYSGESTFNEPYEKPVFVFHSMEHVEKWLYKWVEKIAEAELKK